MLAPNWYSSVCEWNPLQLKCRVGLTCLEQKYTQIGNMVVPTKLHAELDYTTECKATSHIWSNYEFNAQSNLDKGNDSRGGVSEASVECAEIGNVIHGKLVLIRLQKIGHTTKVRQIMAESD